MLESQAGRRNYRSGSGLRSPQTVQDRLPADPDNAVTESHPAATQFLGRGRRWRTHDNAGADNPGMTLCGPHRALGGY
jgi:hypothetical protein